MRVFYAATFSEATKEQLNLYKEVVANEAVKGHFTSQDNLHLTLAFVGEVSRKEADHLGLLLEQLDLSPLTLIGDHMGSFIKKNRHIVWLGIEPSKRLKAWEHQLTGILRREEIGFDDRAFRPHITLGRQVIIDQELSEMVIPKIQLPIKSIALMVSHRVGERLVYEPLEEIILDELD